MGNPTDLFIDQDIGDEFICTICLDIQKDPVSMNPCDHHTYCRECAKEWCKNSKACPICEKRVTSLKNAPRYHISLLNKLEMRCPFNGAGCTTIFRMGDFTDHEQRRCTFNPENKKVCTRGCGAVLTQAQVRDNSHSCIGYLKEQLTAKDKLVQARDTELGVRLTDITSAQEQISKLAQKAKENSSQLESELSARLEELASAQEQIKKLQTNLQNEKDQNSRLEAEFKAKEQIMMLEQNLRNEKGRNSRLEAELKAKEQIMMLEQNLQNEKDQNSRLEAELKAKEQIMMLEQNLRNEKDQNSRLEAELKAKEQIMMLEQNLRNEKDQNSRLEAELKAKVTAQEVPAGVMESSSRGHLKRKLDIDIEDETQAEGETENEAETEEDETDDETEDETEAEDATGDEAENEEPEVKAAALNFISSHMFEMEYSDIKNISAEFSQTIASVVVAELRKWFLPENSSRSPEIIENEIETMLNGPAGKRKWIASIQDSGFSWNHPPCTTIPINATTRVDLNFRNMGMNILVYQLGSTPITK